MGTSVNINPTDLEEDETSRVCDLTKYIQMYTEAVNCQYAVYH